MIFPLDKDHILLFKYAKHISTGARSGSKQEENEF